MQARKKAAVLGLEKESLRFLLADVESANFPESKFHLITCSSGMLYLQHHQQALESMLSWLKPGGNLCFNTPQVAAAVMNQLCLAPLSFMCPFIGSDNSHWQSMEAFKMHWREPL